MILNRLRSAAKGLPLRTVLVVPFVLPMVGIVGLTGYLTWQQGRRSVNQLVEELQRETSEQVIEKLATYLETPHQINQLNAQAYQLGWLSAENATTLQQHFWEQLQVFPSVTSIYLGNQRGGLLGVGRLSDGTYNLFQSAGLVKGEVYRYRLDQAGQPQETMDIFPNVDIRQRPWYRRAAQTQQPGWSDIYLSYSDGELGITAVHPVYDAAGNLQLVFASDVLFYDLHQFLQQMRLGQQGQVFIIEHSGWLVSTSTVEAPVVRHPAQPRIAATDSSSPLIRDAARFLLTHGSFTAVPLHQPLRFTHDGEPHLLRVTPLRDRYGLDWLIVIVVPESGFLSQINANARTTLLLCLGALVIALSIGMLSANAIASPILRLSQASQAMASGHLQQQIDTDLPVKELSLLADSFNRMADQLHHSFDRITTALALSEEKFTKVFRSSPDPIAIATLETGRFIEINTSFLAFTGYVRPEVIGRTGMELGVWQHPTDREALVQHLQQHGKAENYEIQVRLRSGEVRTVLCSAEVIDLEGQRCIIAMGKDITERKQVEVALQQAKAAAEASDLAKTMFLSMMSHNLRTPLHAILGFTQVLQQDTTLTQEQHHQLDIILDNGHQLLRLINHVLELSNIDLGQDLYPTDFALAPCLDQLEAIFHPRAVVQGVQLRVERAATLPEVVQVDGVKLQQVLMNILNYAVISTAAGQVVLHVAATTQPTQPSGTALSLDFTLETTGISPTPAEVENLLHPVEPASPDFLLSVASGMGLALARRYVQLMGDDIRVGSLANSGYSMQFSIRCVPVAQPACYPSAHPRRLLGSSPVSSCSDVPEASTVLEESTVNASHSSLDLLHDLQQMPLSWQHALHQAAIQLDASACLELIRELPAESEPTFNALTELVQDFRFDLLLQLTAAEVDDTQPAD
ncbi:MAG: PAS domain S-box protein [Synechococcales cyanobacterium C42_A2020_086]|nr:PAS domain S-box protein [Synechococcales cyanobacterium C42_A2020_086]